ncbi:uncharacterized protein [Anoplolepis gracilipes]|uniref:uncharacterized protein isoform X1 n=1 Tax=Anoplolepis gracilipes TaxID=354296 RepID=UPI003B9F4811
MQAHSSSDNEANIEPADKESTLVEKKKLLREIQKLERIIEQCEWKVNTVRFENVEEHISELQNWENPSHSKGIPNVEVDLQTELYNFAGFRCVKFRRDEVVFNFTSTNEQQKKDVYAVQIFIKDRKGHLGKWIMPMSIDMNDMLTKIPIDKLENLTPFLKTCKHDIDCYIIRQEQFLSLKKHISYMKHCALQSNTGYTHIILELYGVHDKENDRSMNLIIYLLYHSNKARPYKINIDTMEEKQLSDDLKQRLKICLNEFKLSDLKTAFDKVLRQEDSAFTWIQNDSESSLELNDTSSCESLLVEFQLIRKKSQRKKKIRRELQKKWNKRKRQKNVSTNIELSESNEEDSQIQTKVTRTKSPQQISIRQKETEPVPSTSKQQEKISQETPLYKPIVRLKQTKLNFHINQITNSPNSVNENLSFRSESHNKPDKKKPKMAPLGTSTPLYPTLRKSRKLSSSSSLDIDNITDIKAPKQTADKINDSENSHLKNKNVKRKTSKSLSLQSTTKSIGSPSHLRAVKTNQRHTRSTKNKRMRK